MRVFQKKCLLLAALLALTGCGAPKEAPTEVRYFRLASGQSANYLTNQACQMFCDLVKERSDGRIRIQPTFDNGLGHDTEVLAQCVYGGIDFARTTFSAAAQYAPLLTALQLPYEYTSDEHLFRVLDGTIGKTVLDSLAPSGLIGLTCFYAGYRCFFTTTQPISSLDDMKGLRLATSPSSQMDKLIPRWGGIAVPLKPEEFALALRSGQIDGAEDNLPTYVDSGYYHLAPYWTYDRHTYNADLFIASANTWAGFSPHEQDMLTACAVEAANWQRDHWLNAEVRAMLHASRSGCYMALLDEEQTERFWNTARPIYEELTPAQKSIVDAVQACAEPQS